MLPERERAVPRFAGHLFVFECLEWQGVEEPTEGTMNNATRAALVGVGALVGLWVIGHVPAFLEELRRAPLTSAFSVSENYSLSAAPNAKRHTTSQVLSAAARSSTRMSVRPSDSGSWCTPSRCGGCRRPRSHWTAAQTCSARRQGRDLHSWGRRAARAQGLGRPREKCARAHG
jgi:hypothetical protein